MSTDAQSDLFGFHQFVGEQLVTEDANVSPEQALAMWRQRKEDIAAIHDGLQAVDEERTKPLEQHIREIREQHQLAEDL